MFIFLYGQDSYRSSQKLTEIKQNFIEKTDPSGINIVCLTAEDFSLEKFNGAASQSGFLVAKRLIIVKNLLTKKPLKETADDLVELLKKLAGNDNIFVFWENGLPDKRTALFKYLNTSQLVQDFTPLENRKLADWAEKYLAAKGGQMAKSALVLLLSCIGHDLWLLANELDKLMAYKNNLLISQKDVEELVTAKLNENIFGLTDALAASNKSQALKLLQEQLNLGLNETYLLAMMLRQFRILAEIKSLLSQGVLPQEMASKLKLHPFVIKKSLPQAQKFTLTKFKNIYQKLVEVEKKIKSSALPKQTLLSLLIMAI